MMARRPTPLSLAEAGPVEAPVTAASTPAPAPTAKSTRPPSRTGKRGVAFYLEPEAFRALQLLHVEQDRKLQDLMEEAVDLLFREYGKHPLARRVKAA